MAETRRDRKGVHLRRAVRGRKLRAQARGPRRADLLQCRPGHELLNLHDHYRRGTLMALTIAVRSRALCYMSSYVEL